MWVILFALTVQTSIKHAVPKYQMLTVQIRILKWDKAFRSLLIWVESREGVPWDVDNRPGATIVSESVFHPDGLGDPQRKLTPPPKKKLSRQSRCVQSVNRPSIFKFQIPLPNHLVWMKHYALTRIKKYKEYNWKWWLLLMLIKLNWIELNWIVYSPT